MADQGGGSKPGGYGVAGIVGQALAYIDRPWKLGAVVVLLLVGGVGWVLYEHRDELIESWLTPDHATLKVDAVPKALETLIGDTDADLAQIWAIDLSANSQRFIAARRRDGERPVIPNPRRLPVIIGTLDVKTLVTVLDGSPVCAAITPDRPSPVMRRLAERGMKRACAIPIPPSPDAFVGVIYLTWLTPPDQNTEDVAVGAAREIAAWLVVR